MMIVESQQLLAVNLIFGVVEIVHEHFGRRGEARDVLLHQRAAGAIHIAVGGGVFKARDRETGIQHLICVEGLASGAQPKHRIMAQCLAVTSTGSVQALPSS